MLQGGSRPWFLSPGKVTIILSPHCPRIHTEHGVDGTGQGRVEDSTHCGLNTDRCTCAIENADNVVYTYMVLYDAKPTR